MKQLNYHRVMEDIYRELEVLSNDALKFKEGYHEFPEDGATVRFRIIFHTPHNNGEMYCTVYRQISDLKKDERYA